jgi:hypothetical protein
MLINKSMRAMDVVAEAIDHPKHGPVLGRQVQSILRNNAFMEHECDLAQLAREVDASYERQLQRIKNFEPPVDEPTFEDLVRDALAALNLDGEHGPGND